MKYLHQLECAIPLVKNVVVQDNTIKIRIMYASEA